jgi:hypothetical protein
LTQRGGEHQVSRQRLGKAHSAVFRRGSRMVKSPYFAANSCE